MKSVTPGAGKHLSVKAEFSLWVILFLSATILVLTWFTLRQEREALTAEVTRRGVALAQYVASHSLDPFLTSDALSLATLVADVMKNPDMVYAMIVDRDGRVVAADRSELVGRAYVRPPGHYALDRPEARSATWQHPAAGRVIDIGIPLILQGRTKIGEVHLGVSYSTIDAVVRQAWTRAALVALVLLGLALVGSIVFVTVMLRPVSALAAGAEAIGRGELETRIAVRRRNELGRLAETFNRMARELQAATRRAIEQEKIKKELQLAHDIQMMLLPKQVPEAEGFSFGTLYRAATEVGGDYYDFLWLDEHRLAVAVADVCGKGVPAALLMSVARSMLRTIATKHASPAATVRELNRLLQRDLSPGLFITLFFAILDTRTRVLTYTSAGHNPGMVWRSAGGELLNLGLKPPCLPVGVDRGTLFDRLAVDRRIELVPRDVVVLYTDGVTEAMNERREAYGEENLHRFLERQDARDAVGVVRGLDAELTAFCRAEAQSDDIAVAVIQVDEAPPRRGGKV